MLSSVSRCMAWWVGVQRDGKRDVFEFEKTPTQETHGHIYKFCVGPHQTKKGAEYMASDGWRDVNCLDAMDADRLAAMKNI